MSKFVDKAQTDTLDALYRTGDLPCVMDAIESYDLLYGVHAHKWEPVQPEMVGTRQCPSDYVLYRPKWIEEFLTTHPLDPNWKILSPVARLQEGDEYYYKGNDDFPPRWTSTATPGRCRATMIEIKMIYRRRCAAVPQPTPMAVTRYTQVQVDPYSQHRASLADRGIETPTRSVVCPKVLTVYVQDQWGDDVCADAPHGLGKK